jgi:hypothetical protein
MPARDFEDIDQKELNVVFQAGMPRVQEISQGNGDDVK